MVNKSSSRKIISVLLILLPLLLLIPIVKGLHNREYSVFPGHRQGNSIEAYGDSGNSEVKALTVESKKVTFEYILREGSHYPDAFLTFWLDGQGPFDLSPFKTLEIKMSDTTAKEAVLFIKTFEPGISSVDHEQAILLRHNEKTLSLKPGLRKYSIPLVEFFTPNWWYQGRNINRDAVVQDPFRKVIAFDVHFFHRANTPLVERAGRAEIEEICFKAPPPLFSIVASGLLLLYYPLLLLRLFRKPLEKKEVLSHKPLQVTDYRDEEWKQLEGYLLEHYNNPEITAALVREATGIPVARIYALLKEEHNGGFKKYVNSIRLTEARRLLIETDRRITDIAYKVGFNDVSYFNKLFKQQSGYSPREYRDKNAGK